MKRTHSNGIKSARTRRSFAFSMNQLLLALFLMASVARADSNIFPYVFHESTGITEHIVKDDRQIAIHFSNRSDKVALAALQSLDWRVLYGSADGKHIFLRGELDSNVKRTQKAANQPDPQNYQEFTLLDWHIATPFPACKLVDAKDPLSGWRSVVHPSLKLAGFDTFSVDGTPVSYKRFEQSARRTLQPR